MDGSVAIDNEVETSSASEAPESTSAKKSSRKLKIPLKKPSNEKSTIGFPYLDQDNAITVARAMLDAGGIPLTRDQLASAMGQVPGSGNFVLKTSAARFFGLVEPNAAGKYQLTDLGFAVLDKDETRAKAARAESFLAVPLYKKVYDEFRGKPLPPRPLGLEALFVKLGVSPKQKDKARHAFDKSAAQAGYFPNGNPERLVEPIIIGTTQAAPAIERHLAEPAANQTSGQRAAPDFTRHPFIDGLLQTLPEPGTVWTVKAREKWLVAASNIFELIYKKENDPDDENVVDLTLEMKQ